DRHAGRQLVLHFGGEIPEVVARAPAADEIVSVLHRVGVLLAEEAVADRTAFAVGVEVFQIAVRYVVAVRVVPRAVDTVDRRVYWIIGRCHGGAHRADVAADRGFHGGSAVPEQVIRAADPRVDVLPVRDIVDLAERTGANEASRWDLLWGHIPVEVIEPHPE